MFKKIWCLENILVGKTKYYKNIKKYAQYQKKIQALGLNKEQASWVRWMFCSYYYQLFVAQTDSDRNMFLHYLSKGTIEGVSPSPLYNDVYYRSQLKEYELPAEGRFEGFLHWIKYGIPREIIPTPLFDIDYYRWKYPALSKSKKWLFKHYITAGIYENRSPNRSFDPVWYKWHYKIKASNIPLLYHYLVYGFRAGNRPNEKFQVVQIKSGLISPLEKNRLVVDTRAIRQKIINGETINNIVRKAREIEPKIKSPTEYRKINLPPFNKTIFPLVKDIRMSLGSCRYTTVVCVPHCRMGGAALVAGYFTRAMCKSFPKDKLLLIRTDLSDFERPEWYGDNVDTFDLSYYLADLSNDDKIDVLYDIIMGIQPEKVVNINSRLAWDLLKTKSAQLKHYTKLYAYYFCYDKNRLGKKVGYPVDYFEGIHKNMDGIFTDNVYLKNYLRNSYDLCENDVERIRVLYTPVSNDLLRDVKHKRRSDEILCFWAGRFDRQKRIDIVIEIAKKLKNVKFWVWGKSVLDEPFDVKTFPENIKYQGTFKSFDDLPLDKCTFWLYTSSWDGLPTTLIEVGARGVPIVSSKVGGTTDLINDQTAWPVDDINDPISYVEVIEEFLAEDERYRDKIKCMKEVIEQRHSMLEYNKSLKEVFE